jgi:hypothetical protein
LGKSRNTLGHCTPPDLGWRKQSQCGFANLQLVIVLAILAAIGLLLQFQSCGVSTLSGSGSAKKPATAKRASKAPALIPPAATTPILAEATDKFIAQRTTEIARIDRLQRETFQAYARMDGRQAALVLAEMDPATAVEILAHLRERDIARILEEAEPAIAAQWTAELIKRPEFTPVPDALKDAAAKAGLYDNLPDLLQQASVVPGADTAAPAATADGTTAADGAASTNQSPAADTGAAGATGAPPAAATDGSSTASPAGNPAPANEGATPEQTAAESQA